MTRKGNWRMKGVIFNLLEGVASDVLGEDGWDDAIDRAGVDGAYTAIGSYPDEDFLRLLDALPLDGVEGSEARLRWFGRQAMPLLAARYDVFFVEHQTTRTFLLTLNDIIHPEVRKLYPGADVPVFDFDTDGPEGTLVIGYRSSRRLCALAEGFIEGAADHFGEIVRISQSLCLKEGADCCLIECSFVTASESVHD